MTATTTLFHKAGSSALFLKAMKTLYAYEKRRLDTMVQLHLCYSRHISCHAVAIRSLNEKSWYSVESDSLKEKISASTHELCQEEIWKFWLPASGARIQWGWGVGQTFFILLNGCLLRCIGPCRPNSFPSQCTLCLLFTVELNPLFFDTDARQHSKSNTCES